jgi:hypothetical protein
LGEGVRVVGVGVDDLIAVGGLGWRDGSGEKKENGKREQDAEGDLETVRCYGVLLAVGER